MKTTARHIAQRYKIRLVGEPETEPGPFDPVQFTLVKFGSDDDARRFKEGCDDEHVPACLYLRVDEPDVVVILH
jgi:hypothetical protein